MNTSPSAIKLVVKGSHVPSFKNSKMLTRGRLITNPKKQKWMEQCIQNLELQLLSILAINEDAIQTEWNLPSLIVWSKHFDDSRQWIVESHRYCVDVEKGYEGAEIIIDEL